MKPYFAYNLGEPGAAHFVAGISLNLRRSRGVYTPQYCGSCLQKVEWEPRAISFLYFSVLVAFGYEPRLFYN